VRLKSFNDRRFCPRPFEDASRRQRAARPAPARPEVHEHVGQKREIFLVEPCRRGFKDHGMLGLWQTLAQRYTRNRVGRTRFFGGNFAQAMMSRIAGHATMKEDDEMGPGAGLRHVRCEDAHTEKDWKEIGSVVHGRDTKIRAVASTEDKVRGLEPSRQRVY